MKLKLSNFFCGCKGEVKVGSEKEVSFCQAGDEAKFKKKEARKCRSFPLRPRAKHGVLKANKKGDKKVPIVSS